MVPFIDQACSGLGDDLEADVAPMRRMLARVLEALVAISCSKSFSLYSERTGLAVVLGARPGESNTLESIARRSYSQAPHHGAGIIAKFSHTTRSAFFGPMSSMPCANGSRDSGRSSGEPSSMLFPSRASTRSSISAACSSGSRPRWPRPVPGIDLRSGAVAGTRFG